MVDEESYSASEVYGATYLNAATLKDIEMEGTQIIDKIEPLTFTKENQDPEKKLGIIFQKFPEFQLVLNKTNTKVLVSEFGDDYRKWIGQPVEIRVVQIEVSGKTKDAIRLEVNKPAETD